MSHKEILFRGKRELSEIISDSFDFIKQEIKPLSRLLLIYVLPFIILYAIGQIYMQRNLFSKIDLTDQEMLMNNIGPFYLNLFVLVFFGVFVQSLLFGTYYSYVEAYIKHGKDNFSISDISPTLFSNSLLALGASLVFALIVFFGTIMCFVPGIYFANTFSLAIFILIFQKQGIGNALSRSWKLVNSQWWNTFALNLVGLVIIIGINILLSIPNMLINTTNNLTFQGPANMDAFPDWYWFYNGLSTVIITVLMIIPATFHAFQYFNLEERENPTPIQVQEEDPTKSLPNN